MSNKKGVISTNLPATQFPCRPARVHLKVIARCLFPVVSHGEIWFQPTYTNLYLPLRKSLVHSGNKWSQLGFVRKFGNHTHIHWAHVQWISSVPCLIRLYWLGLLWKNKKGAESLSKQLWLRPQSLQKNKTLVEMITNLPNLRNLFRISEELEFQPIPTSYNSWCSNIFQPSSFFEESDTKATNASGTATWQRLNSFPRKSFENWLGKWWNLWVWYHIHVPFFVACWRPKNPPIF